MNWGTLALFEHFDELLGFKSSGKNFSHVIVIVKAAVMKAV